MRKERERERGPSTSERARDVARVWVRREEEEKTIRRKEEVEGWGGGRGWEKLWKPGRKGKNERVDRYWRWSNNGLLTMIIEHEAAGTLLKSTENRAGGFTCRINFYLVSSLAVPFSFFVFSLFLRPLLYSQSSPCIIPAVTGFPAYRLLFHRIRATEIFLSHRVPFPLLLLSFFSFPWPNDEITWRWGGRLFKDKFNIPRWTRLFVIIGGRIRILGEGRASQVMKIFLRGKLNFTFVCVLFTVCPKICVQGGSDKVSKDLGKFKEQAKRRWKHENLWIN